MDILKFKLPLNVYLPYSVEKNGYNTFTVHMDELDFNSITPKDIEELDGQYDWVEAWCNREFDKQYHGFDNKDVQMEVVYDKGNYIITLVSEKSFDTIVKIHQGFRGEIEKELTLKEAVVDFLEGCIWDGIGENEIGYIMYQNYKCDVWMDCHNFIEIGKDY